MASEQPTTRAETVQSSPAGIVDLRQWLISQLEEYNYCQDDIFAVRLALEEAFYNSVKHGNQLNPKKTVEIALSVGDDKVEILMTDTGGGFNPNAVPDCRLGENLYKTEGRGLLLMRSYMDSVEYSEKGNSVHMVKNKKRQQDAPAESNNQ